MAVPKSGDLAKRQAKARKVCSAENTEYSKFLAMKFDYEHDQLPLCKLQEFEQLKD